MKVRLCFTRIKCFFLSSIKVLYGRFLCKKDLLKQEQEKTFYKRRLDGAKKNLF